MREALEKELRAVGADFIRMFSTCQEMLALASRVLMDAQGDLADQVRQQDRAVDALEEKLESECLRVIVKHQPVASDLRYTAGILRSLTDLERIGDYCVHVAEDGRTLAQEPPLKRYINLGQMIARCQAMLELTGRAFTERDARAAEQAAAMDAEIDDLYEQTQRELITYMLEDARTITKSVTLLRVGRSLQRIGDHIENVSERVRYWVTGERPADTPR
ncbi:MAG TPA: phosphate signaling complex protein PhoU [Deinococcales bacterium]|nr:phosphate signaling complex protein PhoU [Deinococcales bacterium]